MQLMVSCVFELCLKKGRITIAHMWTKPLVLKGQTQERWNLIIPAIRCQTWRSKLRSNPQAKTRDGPARLLLPFWASQLIVTNIWALLKCTSTIICTIICCIISWHRLICSVSNWDMRRTILKLAKLLCVRR